MNQDIFLTNLRTSTAPLHTALEKVPLSASLVSDNLNLADYMRYLMVMHAVVSEVESCIFPKVSDLLPDLSERYKLHKLLQDVRHFNKSYVSSDEEVLRPFTSTPTQAFSMGVMYVMEGSTLGGKIISQHVEKNLGIRPEKGLAYFNCYGENIGRLWKSFLTELVKFERDSGSGKEIIDGAAYAFEAIGRHMKKHSVYENQGYC